MLFKFGLEFVEIFKFKYVKDLGFMSIWTTVQMEGFKAITPSYND